MIHRITGVLLLLVAVFLGGCQNSSEIAHIAALTEQDASKESPYHNKYGIPTDSLWAFAGEISYGETLADILYEHDVSSRKIAELRDASEDVFDVRRLRTGHSYRIYRERGAEEQVRYFVYEPDATSYVVFNLMDPVSVTVEQRSVETIERAVAGVITTSLYETLQDAGASPMLALEMSNVYAWQIDFYRIQRGDRFKVIYEQRLVDGQPVRIGQILGAYFEHRGEDFYAVRFQQEEDTDYFDIEGRSLRKAFLKAPLEYSRISSGFSRRRFHPVKNEYRPHLGMDYAAPRGTPTRSTRRRSDR
jgi:murein DD-endopeptidase MepM/ murein hydrolase activator NlpD